MANEIKFSNSDVMSDGKKMNLSVGRISDVLNHSANVILKRESVNFFNNQ